MLLIMNNMQLRHWVKVDFPIELNRSSFLNPVGVRSLIEVFGDGGNDTYDYYVAYLGGTQHCTGRMSFYASQLLCN